MSVTPISQTNNIPNPKFPAGLSFAGVCVMFFLFFHGLVSFIGVHHPPPKNSNHPIALQHAAEFHSTTGNLDGEAEPYIEVPEEDDIPDEYQVHDLQQKNFSHHEWGYSSFINALYLQLSFSLQRQAEEPIFVLNHSWRSHIS